jgi:hypothetical protein
MIHTLRRTSQGGACCAVLRYAVLCCRNVKQQLVHHSVTGCNMQVTKN